MGEDLTPEELDYSKRLFDKVLDAVITLDAVDGAEAGFVRPDIVRIALLDVIVAVDYNCGRGRVPSERRLTGEALGKRYATFLKSMVEEPKMRGWTPAQPLAEGGNTKN